MKMFVYIYTKYYDGTLTQIKKKKIKIYYLMEERFCYKCILMKVNTGIAYN